MLELWRGARFREERYLAIELAGYSVAEEVQGACQYCDLTCSVAFRIRRIAVTLGYRARIDQDCLRA